jgi:hypothetical protein
MSLVIIELPINTVSITKQKHNANCPGKLKECNYPFRAAIQDITLPMTSNPAKAPR